jgi:hypothetical protein
MISGKLIGKRVGRYCGKMGDNYLVESLRADLFARYFNVTPPYAPDGVTLLDTITGGYPFNIIKQNCVIGDGTAKLTFASLPAYDLITIEADGVETAISLTALEYVLLNTTLYNKVIFKNASVVVEKFNLNEYDSTKTVPTIKSFYGVKQSGATCVLTDDTANISKADGLSSNFEKGFNWGVVSDGVDDYIDLTNIRIPATDDFELEMNMVRLTTASNVTIISQYTAGETGRFLLNLGSSNRITVTLGLSYNSPIESLKPLVPYNIKLRRSLGNIEVLIDDVIVISFVSSLIYQRDLVVFNAIGLSSFSNIVVEDIKLTIGATAFKATAQSDGTLKDQNGTIYTNQGTGDLATVYIPASEITPTEDIAGVTLQQKSGNSQNENYIKPSTNAVEWTSRDDKFLNSVAGELPFFVATVAQEIELAAIAGINEGNSITIVGGDIKDIKLKV